MKRYTGKGPLHIRDRANKNNLVVTYVPGEIVSDAHVGLLHSSQAEGLEDVAATDAASAAMAEAGVTPADVEPTGAAGKITKADVAAAKAKK